MEPDGAEPGLCHVLQAVGSACVTARGQSCAELMTNKLSTKSGTGRDTSERSEEAFALRFSEECRHFPSSLGHIGTGHPRDFSDVQCPHDRAVAEWSSRARTAVAGLSWWPSGATKKPFLLEINHIHQNSTRPEESRHEKPI